MKVNFESGVRFGMILEIVEGNFFFMANHNVKIESAPKHHAGGFPQSRSQWNINNIHDARDLIRFQIGIRSKKGEIFKVYLNDKIQFDSEQFKAS